jgi:hypothetical protein
MQSLIAGVVYDIDPETAPDALIQQLVPDVHWQQRPRGPNTPLFFKSHHLPRPEYRRVVYLLRDGRDVMVSYYHHLAALNKAEPDFLGMARGDAQLWPCKWHEHVEAWLANPFDAQMLVLRYEHLQTAPVEALTRLCKFADLRCDEACMARVVKSTSFEKMRLKEASQGFANPVWPRDKFFIRRGQVGSYRDEMPADVLAAFLEDARPTLLKCGYLTNETHVGNL